MAGWGVLYPRAYALGHILSALRALKPARRALSRSRGYKVQGLLYPRAHALGYTLPALRALKPARRALSRTRGLCQ